MNKYDGLNDCEKIKKARQYYREIEQREYLANCEYLESIEDDNRLVSTYKYEELGNNNLDDIYVDQLPHYSQFYDREVFASYTPYGIKMIDSRYIRAIQHMEKYSMTPERLAHIIKKDPHLHNVIKTNLLYNIKTYYKLDVLEN